MTDDETEPDSKGLTATSDEELQTIKRTLDTIGVDYDVQTVHVVEVEEVPEIIIESDEMEFTEPQQTTTDGGTETASTDADEPVPAQPDDRPEPRLPESGLRLRVATAVDCMDQRWVDSHDIAERLGIENQEASQTISSLFRKKNCVERRKKPNPGKGQPRHEYRLRRQFRGELQEGNIGEDVERALEDPSRDAHK